jgi:chromosome segregation protein
MASARLSALRLVGFKSFAERTLVEFGPGISAIVGPNGSGKSNLADALRWTLGEQGRQLRTRRSEDVIFAGSSSRRAIGMADVTLVIDNQDRLLPVDYGEVEIGRRLYRSGESEYLLNRQRIRLRDLVELLDAGNLADNAFLFIGQGMVDQALALRPEERRPLFEEAAGVRRHERRRRHAEAELVEAEANLDRMRDVLAELRPQARRLAAQAEQLQARRTAGVELAEGLLAAARARWVGSSQAAAQQQKDVERARAAADAALNALKGAEEESAAFSLAIARRADTERTQRDALDHRRAELTELRVAAARLDSEISSLARDGERLFGERTAVERRLSEAARVLAAAVPQVPRDVDAELELLERQLEQLEPSETPLDVARELRSRRAELGQQTQRRDSVAASLDGAQARLADLDARLARAAAEHATAAGAARAAEGALADAETASAAVRQEVERIASARGVANERVAETESELAGLRPVLAALEAAIGGADDGLARAARARGATLLGEGLEVDPRFRAAVSAALGAAASAYLVGEEIVPALAGRRGTVVVPVARKSKSGPSAASDAVIRAAAEVGGGRLADAVRRDPQSEVSRLLERVVWAPDLNSALRLRGSLAPGWRAVSLNGEVVTEDGLVSLSSGESVLERRAEREALLRTATDLEQRLAVEHTALEDERRSAAEAASRAQAAARAYEAARHEQRRREEQERVAQRRAEQLLRESTWERGQVERLIADVAAVESLVAQLSAEVDRLQVTATADAGSVEEAAAHSSRRNELRARRDALRRAREQQTVTVRSAEEARRRAEIGRSLDEARLADLEGQAALSAERSLELSRRREELGTDVASAEGATGTMTTALDELLQAGADERGRLLAAERAAVDARERLREAENASRRAEMAAMEARLQLEQTREQLLVELATIGTDGLRVLRHAAGLSDQETADDSTAAETMEELLGVVVGRWQTDASVDKQEPSPSQGRLGALRRRFNELGAGNPFAVEEYAELRDRLESLDAQRADMESAIVSTRELIASLGALINDQFRTTFAALEDAFQRRFHELFGGGDAQLTLTTPEDLSATGIEIHARPPGKKRQPLSMLSGGERALTAVSLLLAMLEVRPVPFCVLDEVDAALDEANVGRFSKALRGLAEQTQFIVITHNRGTIEAADALYGVTIGDDAVSRVVSLRLPRVSANGGSGNGGPGNGTAHDDTGELMTEAALA